MKKTSLFLLVLVAIAAACSSETGGGDDDDAATSPTPDPNVTPLFASDVIPVFESSCGTGNNACHSRVAYAANQNEDCRGWLSLENTGLGAEFYDGGQQGNPTGCADRSLYERLTAPGLSDAWECGPPADGGGAKVPYVVPGDPEGSYLYRKIAGGPYCGNPSDPMPLDSSLPDPIIDMIYRWIEAGAPQ